MKPAARQGDKIVGLDTHIVMVPSPAGPVPTPVPMPFLGTLSSGLSEKVLILGGPAATEGSKATNDAPHPPVGGPFQRPPSNEATVQQGSTKVLVANKAAARLGDAAMTCNDPADAPNGTVVSSGRVLIGG
jgi:uncharacterized Zn-binding protein involved in type VI secretion